MPVLPSLPTKNHHSASACDSGPTSYILFERDQHPVNRNAPTPPNQGTPIAHYTPAESGAFSHAKVTIYRLEALAFFPGCTRSFLYCDWRFSAHKLRATEGISAELSKTYTSYLVPGSLHFMKKSNSSISRRRKKPKKWGVIIRIARDKNATISWHRKQPSGN